MESERDPERIDRMIEKLRAIWKNMPDWRFGQMILAVGPREWDPNDLFEMKGDPRTSPSRQRVAALNNTEDDEWERLLDMRIPK